MCSDSISSDCGVRRNRCVVVILRSSLMSAVDLTVGLVASSSLASFPGPAQLLVARSTEKRGEPGIFSHVSMM